MEHDGVGVAPNKKNKRELKLLSAIDPSIAEEFVEQARTDGIDLVGSGGLLCELNKQVLETGLEMSRPCKQGG